MKLQLALDDIILSEAVELVKMVADFVDIIEIGTPLVMREGMHAVRALRREFPGTELLADLKIMDAGSYEAALAFDAGADYVTVLGVTDILTVRGCVEEAAQAGGQIIADLICVPDMESAVKMLESAQVHGIAVHTGADQQAAGRTPLEDLKQLMACKKRAKVFVAGGINAATARDYIALGPDVLIVGGGIRHSSDPREEARLISEQLKAGGIR